MKNKCKNKKLTIFYDGECVFCSNLVQLTKLRSKFHEVCLIDARQKDHPLILQYKDKYNFDQGMLVVLDEKEYYGALALNILSVLGFSGILAPVLLFLFKSKTFSKIVYPVLKAGRAFVLLLRGRGFIGY